MGKKSKKKNKKKTSTINERLTDIRTESKMVKKDLTSPPKSFPHPGRAVMNFFSNLAVRMQNAKYILIPEYTKIGDLVKCTLKLKYPSKAEFITFGNSKKHALNCSSLEALQFLKDNNCINSHNSNKAIAKYLSYNDFVNITAKYDKCRKNILDVNKNLAGAQNRNFSTSAKLDIRGQTLEESKHKKPEPKQLALPQPPKSVIHNYYALVSNYYDKDFKSTVHYEQLTNHWECNYIIKWPEERLFVKAGRTKKDSAGKVCIEILKYLQSLKLIDSHGKPIFKEEKLAAQKQTTKIISLKETTIENLNKIHDIYTNKLLSNLTDSLDSLSDVSIDEDDGLFSHQRKILKLPKECYMTKEKTALPISKFKEEIIDVIRNNRVVIVKGEPGCGKSTRVPQYILEGWANDEAAGNTLCRIVITQPRRIAAISLAERVSYERNEDVGQTVGYQVRLQNSFNPKIGRILYCTTGILLRKMQSDPNFRGCSHVILDEVHERDVNTDLLMNLLRYALKTNEKLKVLVMSATIDTGIFQEYFSDAPIFYVPGFTYPVKQHFIDKCSSIDFGKTMQMCDGKHPSVVSEDVVKTIELIHKRKDAGAVLCFLPGWEDIQTVGNLLSHHRDMEVMFLHSRLSPKDQKLIFSKPPGGTRKVILSTNIAETSVTIDDVVYVVDTGIQKETKFDSSKGVVCLDNSWISQANIQQRKGRAGRCQPGESFHLYPKPKSIEFEEFPTPEILRTSLTKIVLDGKVYSNNMNATKFLSQLITPPSDEAIQLAVTELTDLELLDTNENLTPLGRTLSNFQLEPKLAKTMVNAMIFKCVTPIIDIVTLFSEEKELFSGGLYSKDQVKKFKRDFSKISDHLALMKIFEQWLEYVENNQNSKASRFCVDYNLVASKLKTLQQLREIHFDYLGKYMKNVLPISDNFSDNDELIKGVLLSGVGTLIEHTEKIKSKKKKHSLLTRNDHNAMITLESVNSKRSSYSSDYLIYINEMVSNVRKTSVIRETSIVSLLTVLLFKNNKIILEELAPENFSVDINSTDQVLLTLENTKYKYICDRRQAQVIKLCKTALQAMLQHYIFQMTNGGIYDPQINKDWNNVLVVLNKTLEEVQI